MPDPEARAALIAQLLGPASDDGESWPAWDTLTRGDLKAMLGPGEGDLGSARQNLIRQLLDRLRTDEERVGERVDYWDLQYRATIAVYRVGLQPIDKKRLLLRRTARPARPVPPPPVPRRLEVDPLVYKPQEVADMLRISRASVQRMLTDGTIPSVRYGRMVRVPAWWIDEQVGRPPGKRPVIDGDLDS